MSGNVAFQNLQNPAAQGKQVGAMRCAEYPDISEKQFAPENGQQTLGNEPVCVNQADAVLPAEAYQHAELGNDEKGNQQQLEAIALEVGEYAAIVGQVLGEGEKIAESVDSNSLDHFMATGAGVMRRHNNDPEGACEFPAEIMDECRFCVLLPARVC